MSLSDDEIDLLHHSLRLMSERKELAAGLFYPRLFEIAPEVKHLFSGDIIEHTEKTIFAFSAVVAQIHSIEGNQLAADLARRHIGYGVEAKHYPLVGQAVLSILGEVLGEAHFTAEMQAAWRKAYDAISAAMIEVAYGEGNQSAA